MDFAISDLAKLIRGFSADGKALNEALLNTLDKLLNAWFARNNLISKDSVIHEGNEQGEILKDAAGQPKKAQVERVKQLILDNKEGFKQFLEEKGIKAEIQQHKFPEQKPAAQKAAVAAPTPTPAAEQTPQPEEPRGPNI